MSEPSPSGEDAGPKASSAAAGMSIGCGCLIAACGAAVVLFGLVLTAGIAAQGGPFSYSVIAIFALMGAPLMAVGYVMLFAPRRTETTDPAERDGGRR